MACVNPNDPLYIKLLEEIGNPLLAELEYDNQINNQVKKFARLDDYVNLLDANEIIYELKAFNILNSEKGRNIFEKGKKNDWELNKTLSEMGIPKDQMNIINDIVTSITERGLIDEVSSNTIDYTIEDILDNLLLYYTKAVRIDTSDNKTYKNMTVPGGTNYENNEIATPGIIPSIKGHAAFSTDNGIGWFRNDVRLSDIKVVREENLNKKENLIKLWGDTPLYKDLLSRKIKVYNSNETGDSDFGGGVLLDVENNEYYYLHPDDLEPLLNTKTNYEKSDILDNVTGTPTKTRRILEIQSDLFQKWRNNFEFEGKKYTARKDDKNVWHYYKNGNEINANEYTKTWEIFLNTYLNNADAFTKLLQKDNNWVTFFVKSIIQDSAKRGYEKVLFPSGNTASKVEGHTTLEEFKKQKEDRIKELEKRPKIIKKYVAYDISNTVLGSSAKKENLLMYNYADGFNIKEEFQDFTEDINTEITQIKQELERVEREGFAALRPIFNFYENTVTNILKKQGYNPTVITDELGNTWNEINIIPDRDISIIKLGRVTMIPKLEDKKVPTNKDIDNLNISLSSKIDLKELINSNDNFLINKAIDFIDDEEDELLKESIKFNTDSKLSNQGYFVLTNNIKDVKKLTTSEIVKARSQGYDVIRSGNNIEVLNPSVLVSPITGNTLSLTKSDIELANNIMNNIMVNSNANFKKNYSLNTPWFAYDGVLNYNPDMINSETKIVPAIVFASELLKNNTLLPDVINRNGDKSIIDSYKVYINKDVLDNKDYEAIAFNHLLKPFEIENDYLLDFLDGIVNQSLVIADKTNLNILSTVNDYNQESIKKFARTTSVPGDIENSIIEHKNEVRFDDAVVDDSDSDLFEPENPMSKSSKRVKFTKIPRRKHEYVEKNGTLISRSVTDIVRQFKFAGFEEIDYIKNNRQFQQYFENLKSVLDDSLSEAAKNKIIEDKKQLLLNAILSNSFNMYRSYNIDEEEVYEDDEYGNTMLSYPNMDYYLFKYFTKQLTDWEVRAEVGTQIHELFEKIMIQDITDTNTEIDFIKNQIKDKQQEMNDLGIKILPDYKLRSFDDKGYKYLSTDEFNRDLDRLKALLKFYQDTLKMKDTIEKRGGKILTEVVVHTDKMKVNGVPTKVAGQIDMLVVYENSDDVDPEYRGTVEIYDYKTMKYEPTENSPYYNVKNKRQYGFASKKQLEYGLQTMLYKRILEEELNLKVKDVFLIPIKLPNVKLEINIDEKGNRVDKADIDGHFEIVKVNDYDIKEDENNKISFDLKTDEDFKPVTTPLINIKTFSKTPWQTTNVYNYLRRLAYADLMESDFSFKFDEDNIKQEKKDYMMVTKEMEESKKSKFKTILEDIKIYLQTRIDEINKNLSKNPEEQSRQRAAVNKLKTDLEGLDDMQALATFIQSAYYELNGTETRDGIKDRFEKVINEYNLNKKTVSISSVINNIYEVKSIAENYNILDDIMNVFLQNLSASQIKALREEEEFQQLEQAIEIKSNILNIRYQYEMERILAERFSTYLNKNVDIAAESFIKNKTQYYDDQIKKLEDLRDKSNKKEYYDKKINRIKQLKKTNLELYNDMLVRNNETLVRDLKQLNRDIGFIERFFTAPISTSSSLLSTYAMMIKFKLSEAEMEMKDVALKVQKLAKELAPSIFDQSTLNFLPTEGDNPEKFYDPILETVKEWVRDPVTGKITLQDTVNLMSEFGTKLHTVYDSEGKAVTEEMTYKNIIKDYQYRMRNLIKDKKYEEYRKLKQEYETWFSQNMERPYTDEYYELDKFFTDDIGKEAKKRRDEINSMIDNIRDSKDRNDLNLTEDEKKEIRKLQIDYKRLSSIYDEAGNLKEGMDYDVAIRIQQYNELYNKLHTFEVSEEDFENQRAKAKVMFSNDPKRFKLWIEENTEIKLDQSVIDKISYLRKLKKVLRFANQNNETDLIDEVSNILSSSLKIEKFKTKVDELFTKYNLEEEFKNKSDEAELYDKINDLLKPYRLGISNIDSKNIPDDVLNQVKDLEEQIQELYELSKITAEDVSDDPTWENYFLLNNTINDNIDALIQYVPNTDYYKKYEEEKEKADRRGLVFEETAWYLNNHVKVRGEYQPTRAWSASIPTFRITKKSERYNIDRDKELEKIKQADPNKTKDYYDKVLKTTSWYKQNHNEDGNILESSGYLLIDETQTENVKLVPNSLYSRPKVKDQYVRKETDTEKFLDERGFLLPLKSKWANPKLAELKATNPKWYKFHQEITKIYREAQEGLPDAFKLGNRLPYNYKGSREELYAGNILNAMNIWRQEKFGNVATREIEKDALLTSLSSSGADIDLTEDHSTISGTPTYATSLEKRALPFRYIYHIDQKDVSRDVISSILSYVAESKRFKAKSEILPEVKSLLDLVDMREKSTKGGVIERDTKGNRMISAVAKQLKLERFVRKEGETYESALIRAFTQMQVFDDQNVEINKTFNVFGKEFTVRIDKLLDTGMNMASFAQIGGLTSTAWMKGFANYLQANVQMFLESWAGDIYKMKDWAYAKKLVYYGNSKFGSIGVDMMRDFGKITRETLSGQLFDMYDALQGTFKDEFGKDMSASKLNEALRSSSWFINQNIGEIEAATTSMYALLNTYKVLDNGEVYNLDDYLTLKTMEKREATGDPTALLTYDERIKYTKELEAVKNTLLDSFELDSQGKVRVKPGVNWDLKGERNQRLKARLHGINKDLHGNYASFDKTDIQKHVFGRLIMMYRKYLVPLARRRWGKLYRNEEIGIIREGYYMTFFTYLFTEPKKILSLVKNIFTGQQKDLKLEPFEEANIRRALMEMFIYSMLGLLIATLALGDDEDDEEVSSVRWFALYELQRLKKEMGSLMPTYTIVDDNWKLLKNPSAFNSTFEKLLDIGKQMADPFAVYERREGIFEKGDSKLYARFVKLLGNITNATNAEEAYKNLAKPW